MVAGLNAPSSDLGVAWTVIPAGTFPGGVGEVAEAVGQERTWIAVTSTISLSPLTLPSTDLCLQSNPELRGD